MWNECVYVKHWCQLIHVQLFSSLPATNYQLKKSSLTAKLTISPTYSSDTFCCRSAIINTIFVYEDQIMTPLIAAAATGGSNLFIQDIITTACELDIEMRGALSMDVFSHRCGAHRQRQLSWSWVVECLWWTTLQWSDWGYAAVFG